MTLTTISSIIVVIMVTISPFAKASNTVDGVRTDGDSNQVSYKITITNDYKPGKGMALFVLCWRDQAQLGDRVISRGETYVTWTWIDPQLNSETKCYVEEEWVSPDNAVKGKSRYVVVFRARTDQVKCNKDKTCYWSVRDDGFYLSGDNMSWSFVYPWDGTSLAN